MEIAKTIDYDVIIELTPLEIFTGQPAYGVFGDLIRVVKNISNK